MDSFVFFQSDSPKEDYLVNVASKAVDLEEDITEAVSIIVRVWVFTLVLNMSKIVCDNLKFYCY